MTAMKSLASLLVSLVVAVWVVVIAVLSIQNATPVSLKFLSFQSINLPVGLVLAFSAGVGIIAAALVQPLFGIASSRSQSEDDIDNEFSFDE